MSAKFSDKGKTNETLCTLKHGNMGKLTATSYLKNKTPSPQKRSYDPPPPKRVDAPPNLKFYQSPAPDWL